MLTLFLIACSLITLYSSIVNRVETRFFVILVTLPCRYLASKQGYSGATLLMTLTMSSRGPRVMPLRPCLLSLIGQCHESLGIDFDHFLITF